MRTNILCCLYQNEIFFVQKVYKKINRWIEYFTRKEWKIYGGKEENKS